MEINSKYISLKTAAELYGYTRDHLGLMIRQNKLRGMKLGSYYVTTSEWMIDYIKSFADPNHPTTKSKLSNKFLAEILSSPKSAAIAAEKSRGIMKNSVGIIAPNLKKTQNNTIKKYSMDNDLGDKILEDLTQYKSFVNTANKALKSDISQTEKVVSALSDSPYVILPIRRMENAERENILKKTQ